MDEAIRLQVIQKLLDDRDAAILERVGVRQQLNKVTEQDRALERKLLDLHAAARVFGQTMALPADPKDYDSMA